MLLSIRHAIARGSLLLALAALFGVSFHDDAQAATGKPSSDCRRLRGKDLAPARTVKLVRRPNHDDGTTLRGCVLPRGRVRTIARSADFETTVYAYQVMQVSSAIVLVRSSMESQYGASESVAVSNLRSGHAYGVASLCSMLGTGVCNPATDARVASAFVTERGRAAAALESAAFAPGAVPTTVIAGFTSRGRRCDLDSDLSAQLPATSLHLVDMTATWTHSGALRSAAVNGCVS